MANRLIHGVRRWVTRVGVGCFFTFSVVGLAANLGSVFIVTQDQAPLLFYQDGKPTGAEALAKGTYLQAENVAADMVRTTYKGKVGYIQVKFLAMAESILVVAADDAELFYLQNGQPSGLAHLPKGTLITVETRSGDQIITTYNGQSAYLRSRSLITTQAFALAVAQAETAAREQSAQALAARMDQDILLVRALVLDPKNSRAVGDYDKIISNEFRRFIATYPASPYETEVRDRIKDWQAERDQVANGQIKYNGDWLARADFDRYHRLDRAQELFREGDQLIAKSNWPAAVQKYESVLGLNPGEGVEIATKRQLVLALTNWRTASLARELRASEARLTKARSASAANPPQVTPSRDRGITTGGDTFAYSRAKYAELLRSTSTGSGGSRTSQSEVEAAQVENDRVRRTIVQVERRLGELGEKSGDSGQALSVAAPVIPAPAESPDVTSSIASWFSQYWLIGVGVIVAGLFVLTRLWG